MTSASQTSASSQAKAKAKATLVPAKVPRKMVKNWLSHLLMAFGESRAWGSVLKI